MDLFGERMKSYEQKANLYLEKKIPVAIRLDGKAFHTFTKGLEKPFDKVLTIAMQKTMKALCEEIQGCVFGYTQSDEITLILIDYQNENTSAWFDYRIQKMCSVAASMATKYFNQFFQLEAMAPLEQEIQECFDEIVEEDYEEESELPFILAEGEDLGIEIHSIEDEYINCLMEKANEGACFDARCFNVPKEEVCNLIYWRQTDAIRNSIQAVGQAIFSHKELQNKSCVDIKQMLLSIEEAPLDWDNDIPIFLQRGTACYKEYVLEKVDTIKIKNTNCPNIVLRSNWKLDYEMPILKGENREYLEKLINS